MSGERELQKAFQSILGQHFEEAVVWFQKAIEQNPDNADYHYKLSITLARSGKMDEALRHAETALELEPEKTEYEIQMKTIRSKQLCLNAERLMERDEAGNELAVAYLSEAIRLDPLTDRAYMLLAAAWANLNEYKDAIATLRELLELDPEHPTAQTMLEQYKKKLMSHLEENT